MLSLAVRNTKKLVRSKVKEENVRLGRYFTKKEQAAFMADMLSLPEKERVAVLDPGAGTGILSAAVIERLAKGGKTKEIVLDCYETSADFLPMLKDNLERIRKKCYHDYKVRVYYTVKEENYILAQGKMTPDDPRVAMLDKTYYDLIIMNAPRELMKTDSQEYAVSRRLCSGETDLCYLFAAAAAASLAPDGEAVMLLPVVFSTGAYLGKIRTYMFERAPLTRVHLFLNRAQSERLADDARKNMILLLKNTEENPATIRVTTSYGEDVEVVDDRDCAYADVVRGEEKSLLLLKGENDEAVMQTVAAFPCTLSSLGLRMKTGLTLESRHPDLLRSEPIDGAIPLIHPNSIQLGQVAFPHPAVKNQYLVPEVPSLLQKNKNMLFVKRVPAKSDKKTLFCGVYLASNLPKARFISTHNKLNYIDYADDREMDFNMVYGLYVVLNSSLYGKYYQIISKSKQINTTEFADMPLPSANALRAMGAKLIMSRIFSEKSCDALLTAQIKSGKL
jgi:adenine-specific DNA-methyltransferase